MDQRERNTDQEELLRALVDDMKSTFWVAMPCEVLSVDLSAGHQTISCQPQIKAKVRQPDGTITWVELPVLLDVVLQFPQGGQFILTMPVAVGDEVLVIIADRCIDSWWSQTSQSGPTIPPELRFHDLSDGFAIPGIRSKARPLGQAPSASDAQLRTVDGTALIGLSSAGAVSIVAPGGVTIDGDVTVTGQVIGKKEGTFNSIPVSTHLHTGVTSGGSNTGTPTT